MGTRSHFGTGYCAMFSEQAAFRNLEDRPYIR